MKIKLTSVYVDDQDRALRFYTEVLGFVKKADYTNGGYRWLTVASAEEPEGTELHRAAEGRGVRDDRDPARRVREPGAGDAVEEVVARRTARHLIFY